MIAKGVLIGCAAVLLLAGFAYAGLCLWFVANEHSLDPPVLGWGELQDKAHTPTLASSSHTRMLRSRTRPSPQGRTRGFHVTDLGRQVST